MADQNNDSSVRIGVFLDQQQKAQVQTELKSFFATAKNYRTEQLNEERRTAATSAKIREDDRREVEKTEGIKQREFEKTQAVARRESERTLREVMRSQELARRNAEREYDAQARAAQKSIDDQIRQYKKLEEEEKRQRQNSFGSQFNRAVMSSRFNLPGTNGNVMPLVGQTARAGIGGILGMSAVGAASFAASQMADGVKLAMDLERSMNVLQARSGATREEMDNLRKTARDLGGDLELPATSAVDAANAMLSLSKGGLSVKDTMDAARGSLQLAAAQHMDAADAAKILADQLSIFNLQGKEATRVADLMTAVTSRTNVTLDDLAYSMKYVGPVAHEMGIPIEDVTTILGRLAENGIRGETAGTGLRTMLERLNPTSKKSREVLDALGISAYDSSGKFVGMRRVLEQFDKVLPTLTEKQRTWALQVLFGREAIAQTSVILSTGATKFDELKKKVTEGGDAAKQSAAQMKGLAGAIEGWNSALETFKEKHAAPMLDFLTSFVQKGGKALDVLDGLIDRLNRSNNTPIKPRSIMAWLSAPWEAIGDTIDTQNKQFQNEHDTSVGRATIGREATGIFQQYRKGKVDPMDARFRIALENMGVNLMNFDSVSQPTAQKMFEDADALAKKYVADYEAEIKRDRNPYTTLTPENDPLRSALTAQGKRLSAGKANPAVGKAISAMMDGKGKSSTRRDDAQANLAAQLQLQAQVIAAQMESGGQKSAFDVARSALSSLFPAQFVDAKGTVQQNYKGSWDKGTADADIAARVAMLKKISSTFYAGDIETADRQYDKTAARHKGDSDAVAASRVALADANRKAARAKAEQERTVREKAIDDAADKARENFAAAVKRRTDHLEKEIEQSDDVATRALEMQRAYLNAESDLIDAKLEAAKATSDYTAQEQLLQERARNQMERVGPDLFYGIMGNNPALITRALGDIVRARQERERGQQDINDQRLEDRIRMQSLMPRGYTSFGPRGAVNPFARGNDRYSYDPITGMTYDVGGGSSAERAKRIAMLSSGVTNIGLGVAGISPNGVFMGAGQMNAAVLGQRKVDGALLNAASQAQGAVSGRSDQFLRDLFSGGDRSGKAGKNFLQGLASDFGNIAADTLHDKLVSGPLKKMFDRIGDSLMNRITAGGKNAGAAIAQAAMILNAMANLRNPKKRTGTLIGGIVGGIAGSFLGSWQIGAEIGANIGGMFASGGRYPTRSPIIVGEDGPEIVEFDRPGRIHNTTDSRSILNGSMGRTGNGGSGATQLVLNAPLQHIENVHSNVDMDEANRRLMDNFDILNHI